MKVFLPDGTALEGPVEIVTPRDPGALWLIRHDAAHVLATAGRLGRKSGRGFYGYGDGS